MSTEGILAIVAVLAFFGGCIRGLFWVADRFEKTAHRVSEHTLQGLRLTLTETASDLRQSIDGVQVEVAGIREDMHANGEAIAAVARRVTDLEIARANAMPPAPAARPAPRRKRPR